MTTLFMPLAPTVERQRMIQPIPLQALACVEIFSTAILHRLVNTPKIFIDLGLIRARIAPATALRLPVQPFAIPFARNLFRPDKIRSRIEMAAIFVASRHEPSNCSQLLAVL